MPSRCMANYMKICPFLPVYFKDSVNVVEKLSKKRILKNSYGKDICCSYTFEFTPLRPLYCVRKHMLLKLKATVLKGTKYQGSCPLPLPLLSISNCRTVLKYLSLCQKVFNLHYSYIHVSFDFMNYIFVNLIEIVMCLYSLR